MKELPGFWRFLWMFCMQPVSLGRLIRSQNIDPELGFWTLIRRSRFRQEAWWLRRLSQVGVFFSSLPLAATGVRFALHYPSHSSSLKLDAALFLFLFFLGTMESSALGVPMIGLALGISCSLAASMGYGVTRSLTSVLAGLLTPVSFAFPIGGAILFARNLKNRRIFFYLGRFPVFIPEVVWQSALYSFGAVMNRKTLKWSAVLYHEVSFLPLPFLEHQLLREANDDLALTRRVLDACSIAPGQQRIGQRVEAKLRAIEITQLVRTSDFAAMQELRGVWLPGVQGADEVLLGFREAARYLVSAQSAFNAHHKLKHLAAFAAQCNAIENQLRSKRDDLTAPYEEPLQILRTIGEQMRADAAKKAEGLILNPFRADKPLSEEEGPELFRGRESAVREIEEILADTARSASLQLLAPRRAGKSSVLKMLPGMLPDTVCVFFDVQAHPVDSIASFWSKMAEQAVIQAKLDRRAQLPMLPSGPPMEAAASWLEKLDQLPNNRRVLIAIDEFERLEDLFPGSRREFLQLMGLFRATIQHRRNIRLLVSGIAPFEELDAVWDDHFISVRKIKLPFLDSEASAGLLTRPSPEFPAGIIPLEVADAVYKRTGGQPYLLQIFGSLLVSRLNDTKRNSAAPEDVNAVEGAALEWADSFFRDLHRSAPEAARDALSELSHGGAATIPTTARRWLEQRYLLTPDDRLSIPLFGAWIGHHALV